MATAPRWLQWTRSLQSIAQAGLTFAQDPHDVERYEELRRLAAEMAADGTGEDKAAIEGFFVSERGYPTPKVDVRAAVIVEEQILLVRERDDGGWTMPGGWADIGESAAEAVVRETREEAGIEIRAVKLIAVYERERRGHPVHPHFSYKLFFAGEPCSSQEPRSGGAPDVIGAGFFTRTDLPPLSLARVTAQEIELAFEHAADPSLPTEFD